MPLSNKDKDKLKKKLISNPAVGTAPIADHLATTLMTVDEICGLVSHEGVEKMMKLFDMGLGTLKDGEIIAKLKKHITDEVDTGNIQSYPEGKKIINSLFKSIDSTLIELKQEIGKKDINTAKSLVANFPQRVKETLDEAIKMNTDTHELKADILSIHKNYEQQKKGLFGLRTISREKQHIVTNIEKAFATAISGNPDKNPKNIYDSVRKTLIDERDKIKPGLFGGSTLKDLIGTVITTWDARTHAMEKEHPTTRKPKK